MTATTEERYSPPDWPALWDALESLGSDEERARVWRGHGQRWLTDIVRIVGGGFALHEAGGFWIVSNRPTKQLDRVGKLLRSARRRILSDLEGVASDPLYSRLAILWLEDQEQYYDYISHVYPDSGEFSFSGGMFLNTGYPHFVFPHYEEFWQLEKVMSHELTHALVSHLPLPLWLNEGMAVTMEEAIAGRSRAGTIPELFDQYPDFWNEQTIQEFWSGHSFSRSDEGNELSYAMGHLLTTNLAHEFERFRAFATSAQASDGGEAAAHEAMGISLGDLVGAVLGEGNWAPRPDVWNSEKA